MYCEFEEDIGKEVTFYLKNGRKYSGKILSVSKNCFIKLDDIKGKPVKIAEDNVGNIEFK